MSASQCRRPWVCMVILSLSVLPGAVRAALRHTGGRLLRPADSSPCLPAPPTGMSASRTFCRRSDHRPRHRHTGEDSADAVDAVEDSGSRTPRRGLQLLDAILAGGREGLRVVDLCRAAGPSGPPSTACSPPWSNAAMWRRRGASAMWADRARRRWAGARHAGGGLAPAAGAGPGQRSLRRRRLRGDTRRRAVALHRAARGQLSGAGAGDPCRHAPAARRRRRLALLPALPDREVENVIAANAATLERYGGMTPERMRIWCAPRASAAGR